MDYKTEQIKNKLSEMESHVNDSNDASLKNEFYELKNLISSKLDNVKYGLVFEESKEDIEIKCENMIPYLEREREINASAKNGKNFLIEGDNYASLKLLEKTHKGKIDIIYIDPPYNTGNNDFIYNDNKIKPDDMFKHSQRLSFMRKRIEIARILLSEDGVIFISIDEHEFAQLKIICDEVFSEENFIENFIWIKNVTKNLSKTTSTNHEYVFCYAKNLNSIIRANSFFRTKKEFVDEALELVAKCKKDGLDLSETEGKLRDFYKNNHVPESISLYKFVDKEYRIFASDNPSAPLAKGTSKNDFDIIHPITHKPCKKTNTGWRFSYEKSLEMIKDGLLIFGKDETKIPRVKRFLANVTEEIQKSIIEDFTDGKKELQKIFNSNNVFENPKPTTLIKTLVKSFRKNSIILDFFAGSGTTGQAVLELNKEDGGNRHFILCTNNENNICEDVTYERLKTVITGKRKDGSIYRENPYSDNLTYLKVNFAEKDDNIEPYKICEELIALKSSIETCLSFIFDKDEDFYEFLNSNIYLDNCVVYLLDDILLPSGSKLKERKMEIRELPKYFYNEEELINNDII